MAHLPFPQSPIARRSEPRSLGHPNRPGVEAEPQSSTGILSSTGAPDRVPRLQLTNPAPPDAARCPSSSAASPTPCSACTFAAQTACGARCPPLPRAPARRAAETARRPPPPCMTRRPPRMVCGQRPLPLLSTHAPPPTQAHAHTHTRACARTRTHTRTRTRTWHTHTHLHTHRPRSNTHARTRTRAHTQQFVNLSNGSSIPTSASPPPPQPRCPRAAAAGSAQVWLLRKDAPAFVAHS